MNCRTFSQSPPTPEKRVIYLFLKGKFKMFIINQPPLSMPFISFLYLYSSDFWPTILPALSTSGESFYSICLEWYKLGTFSLPRNMSFSFMWTLFLLLLFLLCPDQCLCHQLCTLYSGVTLSVALLFWGARIRGASHIQKHLVAWKLWQIMSILVIPTRTSPLLIFIPTWIMLLTVIPTVLTFVPTEYPCYYTQFSLLDPQFSLSHPVLIVRPTDLACSQC